jgi:NAD(P)-dependent dehydrogenase (short-subunit alcohol dehydrogenase family)
MVTTLGTRSVKSDLAGQTVVVVGGSSGIGLETARLASAEGAKTILTGRDPERLRKATSELGAFSSSAFDATNMEQLGGFFGDLRGTVDHVMVTAGSAYYAALAEMEFGRVRSALDEHVLLVLGTAKAAANKVRAGGTLVFMAGTGARRPGIGLSIAAMLAAGLPALIANLALELAPIRVNLIAAGFVDSPLSARVLGDDIEKRREQLRATLPIGRVVEPTDVAALAVHLMSNSALTGATYDIDGGEQVLPDGWIVVWERIGMIERVHVRKSEDRYGCNGAPYPVEAMAKPKPQLWLSNAGFNTIREVEMENGSIW